MSQIFRPSANSYARGSIVAVLLLVSTGFFTLDRLSRSPYATRQNTVREQPVQFSHQHHAGGLGIDCRFCHVTVEKARIGGHSAHQDVHELPLPDLDRRVRTWKSCVPASATTSRSTGRASTTCLTSSYFNHSVHVKKGVGCATCHGRVDKMPLVSQAASLQMSWCLDCHRNPAKYVRPRELVTQMDYVAPPDQMELGRRLVKEYQIQSLTSCSTCHR